MYFNREEKSLRHITMVAKFLDDNKPVKSLKSLFALFQISPILFNILFNLANLGEIFFGTIYRYPILERQRQFLCFVQLPHKAGSLN